MEDATKQTGRYSFDNLDEAKQFIDDVKKTSGLTLIDKFPLDTWKVEAKLGILILSIHSFLEEDKAKTKLRQELIDLGLNDETITPLTDQISFMSGLRELEELRVLAQSTLSASSNLDAKCLTCKNNKTALLSALAKMFFSSSNRHEFACAET